MKILHCKNIKNHRDDILKIKSIDSNFNYNFEEEELFLLRSERGKLYGYSIVKIDKEKAVLFKIFIIPRLRNNGYGTILLNNIVSWLINNEYDNLIVENHKQMNNFLEKQKFVKTENGYELNNLLELKKEEKTLLFISKFAIVINVVLAFLKIISGKFFNSSSLVADGLNSLSDLVTNIIVILGLKMGRNIEDKEHPYGHGKIESIFSVIIGTFIMLTAIDMVRSNLSNIFVSEKKIIVTPIVLVITLIALIIKVLQFIYMKYKTKKYKGPLIKSLLKDYKSDIIITISVLLGIVLSKINPMFDILIGTLVGINILKSGYELISENAHILMDLQDKKLLENIKIDISEIEEVKNAHDFRMTTSGKSIFLTLDIRVDKNKTVEEAHDLTNEITKLIKHKYQHVKQVIIHVEPMYLKE